ncbi:hypothetical protein VNO78_11118 [Psophocarpus tetragonolobus]|uniref:Uncharacterized protein n=1 Tax=Psophocarpus tetragonolobus TaxID=3891 RepID=A0AAN9SNM3_PSOTE
MEASSHVVHVAMFSNFFLKIHGGLDAPLTYATAKSFEPSAAQRSTRIVPKAPTSQPPAMNSDPAAPTTPSKADASKAFLFQFGSISPGFMNGMAEATGVEENWILSFAWEAVLGNR